MKEFPIIGVAGKFIGKPNDEIIDIALNITREAKSTPVKLWFGPILGVFICEPEDIQIILTSDDCLNKPYFYDYLHCKTSIIATDREIWKPHRRALNTAFNVKVLQSYLPDLNDKSRILLQQMEPFLSKSGDLYRIIFICMLGKLFPFIFLNRIFQTNSMKRITDMIMKTTMGTEMNLQSEQGAFLYKICKLIMTNLQYRISRIWLKWDCIYNLSKVGK